MTLREFAWLFLPSHSQGYTLTVNRRAFFASIFGLLVTQKSVTASGFTVTGHLTDAGETASYALGQEICILAKPGSTADRLLSQMLKSDVVLTIRPTE